MKMISGKKRARNSAQKHTLQSVAPSGSSLQPAMSHPNGCGVASNCVVDQSTIRKELANMIALHKYPLSIVDHVGFRKFSSSLNPHFKMVSRSTVKSDILKIFEAEKSKKKSLLESYKFEGRIAVSVDTWTSHDEKRQFIAATAHFIDDTWTLQSHLISFSLLPERYTEKVLFKTYIAGVRNWKLDYKLSTLTFDDCIISDDLVKEFISENFYSKLQMLDGKYLRMRCLAHTLNLLVREGLAILGEATAKIRDSFDYWTATPRRESDFRLEAWNLRVSRSKNLVLDCETRWDSTYLMLETALCYRDVFKKMKEIDSDYTCIPSDEDWNLTKEIGGRLKVFYEASKLFSGKNYPTANVYFSKVCDIKLALSEWVECDIEIIKDMASKMMEKFDKYWNDVHTFLAVAVILDPRYKMYVVEYYFQKIYEDNSQHEIDKIRKICSDLFEEYKNDGTASSSCQGKIAGVGEQDNIPGFDVFVSENKKRKESIVTELDFYLDDDVLPRDATFDILSWWRVYSLKYPTLHKIARDVLAIPVSKVVSDSAFSTVSKVLEQRFDKLHPKTIEALMCQRNWLSLHLEGASLADRNKYTFATVDDDSDEESDL